MPLSKQLKDSISKVLCEDNHLDTTFVNKMIESIESTFYEKKGTSIKNVPVINESLISPDLETDAKLRMKNIITSTKISGGRTIPQESPTISKVNSAASSMKRILG